MPTLRASNQASWLHTFLLKTVVLSIAACSATACTSTTTNYYASPNDSLLAVGDTPPDGYPRSYLTKEKNGCIETTESWKKEPNLLIGKVAWLKQVEYKAVSCR